MIIPVYNEEKFLGEAINYCLECLENDFDDYEIILINDGSSDRSGNIIADWERKDRHIIVIDNLINLNMGISVQRGLVYASKEYVIFNAVDLPFNPIETKGIVELAESTNSDILCLERRQYLGTTRWRRLTSFINRLLLSLFFPCLKRGLHDTNFTQLIRKEILNDIIPLAHSPIFTFPEMIFRARYNGLKVKPVSVLYKPRILRKGAFGYPHDMIWGIYDMIRFRIRLWIKNL
jgi:undecaprenyl-phosphate 4-deoxy-4-formamido-L-arabinose transferase